MKRLHWWLYVVFLSFKWIGKLNLGTTVRWNGGRWTLVQGVCAPRWDLMRGNDRVDFVHEREFKAVQNPIEWWRAFKSGYRFYMGYWFDIWVSSGIEPWMRRCKIWK